MSEEKSAPAASDPADLMLKLAQSLFGSRKGSEKEGLSHRLLDKSEQKYRTLVEQIPAVTFLASFEEKNNEIYVSPQIESLLGYTQEEWLSEPILWYQRLHPDDQGRWNRRPLAPAPRSEGSTGSSRGTGVLCGSMEKPGWLTTQTAVRCSSKA
jgi:PAS domain-containing protein